VRSFLQSTKHDLSDVQCQKRTDKIDSHRSTILMPNKVLHYVCRMCVWLYVYAAVPVDMVASPELLLPRLSAR
jgi:hypothetical protein